VGEVGACTIGHIGYTRMIGPFFVARLKAAWFLICDFGWLCGSAGRTALTRFGDESSSVPSNRTRSDSPCPTISRSP